MVIENHELVWSEGKVEGGIGVGRLVEGLWDLWLFARRDLIGVIVLNLSKNPNFNPSQETN